MACGIRAYEPGHHEHLNLRMVGNGLRDTLVRSWFIHGLAADANQIARIEPQRVDSVAAKFCSYNAGGEQLSEGLIIFGVGLYQVLECVEHRLYEILALLSCKQAVYNSVVPVKYGLTRALALCRLHGRKGNQLVGTTADCRTHQGHLPPRARCIYYVEHPRYRSRVRNRCSAEFQYLHISI